MAKTLYPLSNYECKSTTFTDRPHTLGLFTVFDGSDPRRSAFDPLSGCGILLCRAWFEGLNGRSGGTHHRGSDVFGGCRSNNLL